MLTHPVFSAVMCCANVLTQYCANASSTAAACANAHKKTVFVYDPAYEGPLFLRIMLLSSIVKDSAQ